LQLVADTIPERIAIDDGAAQVTYADLVRRVNRVARAIVDAEPDPSIPVAIIARQGIEPVVAFLAPLQAGRLSAPLDAGEPIERLRRMVDTSLATTVVTERRHFEVARAAAGDRRRVIVVEDTAHLDSRPPEPPRHGPTPGFIVFTSGSTGTPKGVVIADPHLVRNMIAQRDFTTFPLDARIPLIASFGFSTAVGQVIFPLLLGATVCPFDLPSGSARQFAEWVNQHDVTTLSIVPSLLRALAALEPAVSMPSVQTVTLVGEQAYGRDVVRARGIFGSRATFVNAFGSTEAYTVANYVVGPDDDPGEGPLPAGTLSPSVTATIVGIDSDEPVRDGEAGRLIVVADFMAHGYWDDPDLTAAHFFTAADGRQGFRSSDLVRFRADGNLEHLGRLDARVKVRGAMVSVSEVERALREIDGVEDAAVASSELVDRGTRLVAYVAGTEDAELSVQALRRELAERLPTTMVPGAFVIVDQLPRTVRGKVDREALPPLPVPPPYREPVGKERELAELFSEVLGVERVGVDDDFFALGGDSLAAVELIAGIGERFGVDVPSTTLLDAPTVGRLAPLLGHRRSRRASVVVPLRTDRTGLPLFCVTGAGAPALALRAFADAFTSRPVYGIQPRGLEERAVPDWSVGAAAHRAIRDMRAACPAGPYMLAGYSFGALVAFEAARRLEATGDDSGVLVILDGHAPRRRRKPTARAWRLAKKLQLLTAGPLPRRGLQQYEQFLELNMLMDDDYAPTRTYGGALLLLRTHLDVPDGARGRYAQRDFGWSRVVTGPITIVDVPGDHLGLLRQPMVAVVAAKLREALA
jgi:amino acid adenylation domain-containing protein